MPTRKTSRFITTVKPDTTEARRDDKVTFILLAENYGHRMKSYGPVSLIKIGNKSLIEHQVDAIKSVFIDFEIILCSGFETQKVYQFLQNVLPQDFPIRIVENQIYYHSNCCEGLRLCLNNTRNNKIVVCGGGVLLTVDYLRSLNVKKSSILYQSDDKDSGFDVGIIENDNRLENFSLAVDNKVWTDLLYITGEPFVKSFYSLISRPEFKNKFLFEAVNSWRAKNNLWVCENAGEKIIKVDNIRILKRMHEE
jgi:choline kinase